MSVVIIHWRCFQVSNAFAHLAKKNNLQFPEQFPSFLYAVLNGIKPLRDEAAFPKLIIFLKTLANCVDSMLFHCFYDSSNFVSKYFQKTLIEVVQTLPQLMQLWQVHTPLNDFLKKLLVQRNALMNKKCNGIILLP